MTKGYRGKGGFLIYCVKTKWPQLQQNQIRRLLIAAIVILGGCAGLTPPSENTGGGINLDYLFGARRPADQARERLVNDPEYAEYLEWKRWQEFQAYQKWRRLQDK